MPTGSERPQPPRQPSMPTVRQGPKPSRSKFVIRGPLNPMPWWRLHSPPSQPPEKYSLSYSQGGRLQSQIETAHLIPGSLIRPRDVYVPVGDDGMAVAYDVTVVSPVVESSLSSTAHSVGFAADTAERRKSVHYATNCASGKKCIRWLAQLVA
jgi:hypothetical protein